MTHRFIAPAALALAVLTVAGAALAQSQPISLQIDRSQRVTLRGPAGSVIVANPEIADVTVVGTNTLYITGKGYGVTEIVAVDAIGRPLLETQVVVTAGTTGAVRVWRGAEATEMACADTCSPSVRSAGAGANNP